MSKVNLHGQEYDFDSIVNLMDDETRELVHSNLAPCSDQYFMDAYFILHLEKFGQEFVVN